MTELTLNKNQRDYLEIISDVLAKKVKENNISKEYFEANFNEIFMSAHNSYQNFLKGLITDEEYKNNVFEQLWNENRG